MILEKILKFNVTNSAILCILNAVSLQIQGLFEGPLKIKDFSRTTEFQGLFKARGNSV
jgi:hypothetical protein